MIHVCRNFKGILNSEQKNVEIDIEKGIEEASRPKRFYKVFKDWFISNSTSYFARLLFSGTKLRFTVWIQRPQVLRSYHKSLKEDFHNEYFKAPHMLAGNAIRMKPPQKLRSTSVFEYNRLDAKYKAIGRLVELLFPFWS